MTLSVRPIAGLLLAPAVPAVVLAAYSLPSNFQMVLPLAKTVLLYGYVSAFLVALPILVVFSGYFSRKPLAVIPLAGVTGALAGASPFVLVALNEGINLSDWPLLIAAPSMSRNLSTYRRRSSAEARSDRPERLTGRNAPGDVFAFG